MTVEIIEAIALEEAERKLAIAREALKEVNKAIEFNYNAIAYTVVTTALAQIGEDDE